MKYDDMFLKLQIRRDRQAVFYVSDRSKVFEVDDILAFR